MTSRDEVIPRVLALVAAVAGPERTPANLHAMTPLSDGGFWLDSVGLLELIVACEAEFGIMFDPDRDLTGPSLDHVESLSELIVRKLAGPAPRGTGR